MENIEKEDRKIVGNFSGPWKVDYFVYKDTDCRTIAH